MATRMSKKHYELIAEAINAEYQATDDDLSAATVRSVAENIATALEFDNPKFDRAKFLGLCGVEQMEMEAINSAGQARDKAIAWQHWASNQSLSYAELSEWQSYFEALAQSFDLTEEFKENGII